MQFKPHVVLITIGLVILAISLTIQSETAIDAYLKPGIFPNETGE